MIHHTGARGYAPYFATHPNPGCSSSPSPKPYHRSLPFYQLLAGQYATSQVAPCDSYRKLVPRSRVCANATGQAMSPHSSTKYDKERRQQQIKWHAHVRYSDGGCYVKRLRSMRSVEPHHRRNLQRNVTVTSPLQEITVQSPIATISIQAPAARSPHRKTCNKQLSLRLRPSPTTCEKQKGFSIERDKKKTYRRPCPLLCTRRLELCTRAGNAFTKPAHGSVIQRETDSEKRPWRGEFLECNRIVFGVLWQ